MANATLPEKPIRRDPHRRRADNAGNLTRLEGQDPSYAYVLVYLRAEEYGVEFYEQLGYEKCVKEEGKAFLPAAPNSAKRGEVITYRGHVLMRVLKSRKDEIEVEGPDGDSGQRAVDALENRIIDKRLAAGEDPMRGVIASRNPYFRSVNETTPLAGDI